jgi:hypothetical protein
MDAIIKGLQIEYNLYHKHANHHKHNWALNLQNEYV